MKESGQFQNKTLLELIEIFSAIPFNRMLGLRLDAVENDHICMSFAMKKDLVGNFLQGILHGGVISSVLDMAGGVASMISAVEKHQDKTMQELKELLGKSSTVDLHVSFIHPGKGEHFTAKAWVLHSGKRLSFARIELYNDKEILIATGAGTYLMG